MADPGEIGAAGAVLCRRAAGGVEIALIHRIRYGDWSFPKGKIEPGEHVLATAVREVREETGIAVVLGRKLGRIRYEAAGAPKRVDYWAGWPAPGSPVRFAANSEVDDMIWLPPDAARARLSYPHDAQVLDELMAGPLETVPLILLRHASAGSKGSWPGDDLARPLDERGMADAELLARLLSGFGQCAVISSAAERCLATVRPYARRAGLPITVEPALTTAPQEASPAAVRALGVEVAARAESTVICAHGENLGVVLAAACEYLGADPPASEHLDKGGFWALHVSGRTLAGAQRYRLAVAAGAQPR
jgi:8-oxo-dGTP pyrophosphatase MutT (NUDIX family)/phosphohistidine phosphatase SixA